MDVYTIYGKPGKPMRLPPAFQVSKNQGGVDMGKPIKVPALQPLPAPPRHALSSTRGRHLMDPGIRRVSPGYVPGGGSSSARITPHWGSDCCFNRGHDATRI